MTELKPSWQRVKFGEVVRLNKETCKDPIAAGIKRVIGLEHLEPGDLRVRSWGDVADGTTFTNRVRPGQVLFGKRRAYQRKVAMADFDAVCSGDIYVLESADPEQLLPELLPFICQTDAFLEHAVGTSAGSLSPRTNWSSLAMFEFELPPFDEQLRLLRMLAAAKDFSEKARTTIEAAEAARSRLEDELMLPAGIKFGIDRTLAGAPEGWRAASIRDLCLTRSDLTIGPFGSNLLSSDYAGRSTGVPVVFVRDIRPNRFRYISDCFVSADKADELKSHLALPGDLLITKVGVPETMGIPPGLAAVLPEGAPLCVITADVVRARVDSSQVKSRYIARLLNTAWGRQQTWRISPGSTTRFKMNLSNFSAIRLPIPPLAYQQAAIECMEKFDAILDLLERRRSGVHQITSFGLTKAR
jgi:type I restriction enzyme S subunit